MKSHTLKTAIRAALALPMVTVCLMACAQSKPAAQGLPPPPEALAACKTLQAGQDCEFTGPRGVAKGSCWAPEGKPLACKPKDAPEHGSAPK